MLSDPPLYLFVLLRSLHILVAALWLGSAALLFWFVMPAAGNLAPETVARLARKKLHAFMPSVAGTTVLSGLLLYWHLTGFSETGMSSHAGIAFGIGGGLGLAALAIGGGVVGRSAAKVADLYASAGDDAPNGQTAAAIEVLLRRMAGAGRVVIALLLATLILMTLGHFV